MRLKAGAGRSAWTSASLVCFLGLFLWGASVFLEIYKTPQGELSVFVVAKQWMWKVQHAGGQSEINALHIPVNRPMRLVMASQDVIHSFFIPALRLKHDVVPGRYQDLEIEAEYPAIIICSAPNIAGPIIPA